MRPCRSGTSSGNRPSLLFSIKWMGSGRSCGAVQIAWLPRGHVFRIAFPRAINSALGGRSPLLGGDSRKVSCSFPMAWRMITIDSPTYDFRRHASGLHWTRPQDVPILLVQSRPSPNAPDRRPWLPHPTCWLLANYTVAAAVRVGLVHLAIKVVDDRTAEHQQVDGPNHGGAD